MFRYRWQQHSIVLQRTDGGETSTCHPSSLLPGITIILSRYLCSLLASRNVFSERIPGKRINKPYKIAAVLSMKHENCVRKFQDITNPAAWCITYDLSEKTGEDGISSLSTGEPHHNMVRVWLVWAVWAGVNPGQCKECAQWLARSGWARPGCRQGLLLRSLVNIAHCSRHHANIMQPFSL